MPGRTFEGSLTEKMLHILVAVKRGNGRGEITSTRLQEALHDKFPKYVFNESSFGTAFDRIKKFGILLDSGAKIGRSKILTIVPEPEDIVDLYKHKGDANAMADARARNASVAKAAAEEAVQPAAETPVETSDDDVMDSWTFGEKIIRYISILKQKLNERDSMLRERSTELDKAKGAIKGLQDEVNKKNKKLEEIREGMKDRIPKGRLIEEQQKVKRLEAIVDDLRKNPKGKGTGFQMKDMARFK